jgi:hypothetical protein
MSRIRFWGFDEQKHSQEGFVELQIPRLALGMTKDVPRFRTPQLLDRRRSANVFQSLSDPGCNRRPVLCHPEQPIR